MKRSDSVDALAQTLHAALRAAGRDGDIESVCDLSGGCIHRVVEITLADCSRLVAKINAADRKPLFDEELQGLQALAATKTVLTPVPLASLVEGSHAILLMSRIEPPAPSRDRHVMAEQFGRELAALHLVDVGERYGFSAANHIGSTFQPNHWCEDWVQFNREHRLGFQLRLARDAGKLKASEARRIEAVIEALDRFLPVRPKPALLHGDLWSGNALPAQHSDGTSTLAVIDPACSIGDGWADIAMMKLFGGFDEACFAAYVAANGNQASSPERIAVYQLYHVLNHVNLFGRGYAPQAMSLASELGF